MTLLTFSINNYQTYYHPLTSPNMFMSLRTYIIIQWTALSLLLTLVSSTISQSFNTVSYHFPIFTHPNLTSTSPPTVNITFSCSKTLISEFYNNLASSDVILFFSTPLIELLYSYDSKRRSILEEHLPLIAKFSNPDKPKPWYTPALLALKSARRQLERKSISTHSASDYTILRTTINHYHKLIAHNLIPRPSSRKSSTHCFIAICNTQTISC